MMPWEQGGARRLMQGAGREMVVARALALALELRGWMDGWKMYLLGIRSPLKVFEHGCGVIQ